MKDSQRAKVYDAEWVWYSQEPEARKEVSLGEAREILSQLCAEFVVSPVNLQVNGRIKRWGGWYARRRKTIEIPRDKVLLKVLLHEFSHHLHDERYAKQYWRAHGAAYTETMFEVVDFYFGQTSSKALKESYGKHKVAVGADVEKAAVERNRELAQAATDRNYRQRNAEGTVYIVEYDKNEKTCYLYERHPYGGFRTTIYDDYALAYRYKKSALKAAGKLADSLNPRVVERDGYYDHVEKRWRVY